MINTLLVNDDDLNCDCKDLDIDKVDITKLNFINADLEKFDLIVYSGKRGRKILKSKYFRGGVIS